MDVCEGQFDLETMSSCADPELGTRGAYPLELVAYANAVPSPDDLSIFHVSISCIPSHSHHMVMGDQITYEDDQYHAIGTATSKHTSSNGRCTVVIRGRIHNKITGSIGYDPSITEDTPQYRTILVCFA
jgi:sorbitol-specific phosphotransferase system component IIA